MPLSCSAGSAHRRAFAGQERGIYLRGNAQNVSWCAVCLKIPKPGFVNVMIKADGTFIEHATISKVY